jgi:hypothetical protein
MHRIVCGPTRTNPDARRSCFVTWPTLPGVGIGQIDLRPLKTAQSRPMATSPKEASSGGDDAFGGPGDVDMR